MVRILSVLALASAVVTSGALAAPILDIPETIPPAVTPAPTPAVDPTGPTTRPVVELTAVAGAAFPFTGVVRVEGAYVRGGASKNHFPVARLAKGTEVQVVRQTFDWYQVKPPAGVFCWIHKNYVTLDATGKAGTVSGDNVNVRGDSIQGHEAVKSDVLDQVKKGLKVTVVGAEGEWLRIEPTPGAVVFVSADLVTPKGVDLAAVRPGSGRPESDTTAPAATAAEDALDKAEQALQAERLKKPTDWDLDKLLAIYRDIVSKPTDDRTKEIAESRVAYLDQLAKLKGTLDEVEKGRQRTEEDLKAVEAHRAAQEAARTDVKIEKLPYTITGILQTLELTDGKPRFKLVDADDRNKILCIVEGTASVLQTLVGKRVGVNGEFRVSGDWPVKVIQATEIAALRAQVPEETRTAQPPK